jgi:hypothetical protein
MSWLMEYTSQISMTIYYHPAPPVAEDRLLDETWSAVPPCEILIYIVHETGIRAISVVPVSVIRLSLDIHRETRCRC